MKIRKAQNVGDLTPELLAHFELRTGSLPDDYKVFILNQNGGTPAPELMFPTPAEDGYIIAEFTSIDCRRGQTSVELTAESWELSYGKGWIEIGGDGTGNYFLLSISAGTLGHMYFLDHEQRDEEDPESGFIPLTRTFSEFLGKLRETDCTSPADDQEYLQARQRIIDAPQNPWWKFW